MSQTVSSQNHRGWFIQQLSRLPTGHRSRWVVLAVWLAIIAIAGPLGDVASVERNDAAVTLPRESDSLAVVQVQERYGGSELHPAVVVAYREGGLTEADVERLAAQQQTLASQYAAVPVSDLEQSSDGTTVFFAIPLDFDASDDPLADLSAIRAYVTEQADGMDVYVTGPAGFTADLVAVFDGIDVTLLLGSVLVVAVLLLLTYRSPFLWLLPLLTVGVAHVTAMAAVFLLARDAGLIVSGLSGGILPILVFGVGTDYAFLIIARYREELRRETSTVLAMQRALRSAMPAIAASSSTCIAGLLCLSVAGTDQIRALGIIGALGIACALVAMVTLLPALLLVTGRRVFWPFVPRVGDAADAPRGVWAAVGRRVARAPRLVGGVTVAVLAVMALGVTTISTLLPLENQFRDVPESIAGQQAIDRAFPGGVTAPAVVIAEAGSEAAVERAISETPGVARSQSRVIGEHVAFDVTLDAAPGSSAAFEAVRALRASVAEVDRASAIVGGPDAQTLDTQDGANRDLVIIVPLVLLVVLTLLILLLRSVVAPVVLVGTVLLSFAAALGISLLVFQHLFDIPALEPSVPLLAFVFLVALGVDYNIFLMTRVQEEARRRANRDAVIAGLAVTGGVITSAGLVLAATFSVLTVLPLVMMMQLGFIVAFGVLLDAIIVRSVLVPAIAMSAGDRIWWPLRIERVQEHRRTLVARAVAEQG